MSWKTVLHIIFTTQFKTCLLTNQVVASCLNTDLLFVKNRSHTIHRIYVTCYNNIQGCLGLVKCVTCTDFVAKRRSTSCNTFLQPATAWFVARQVWLWVVKCAVLLFNSFCSIMSQNNSHIFVADFTVALEVWIYASRSWGRMISFGYDTNLRTCCREVFRRFHEK